MNETSQISVSTHQENLLSITNIQRSSELYHFLKRAFDIMASLAAILLLSPVYLLLALLVKLSDGGPVIHVRRCVGKNSAPYSMYKFRTMVQDADKVERWLSEEQKAQYWKEMKVDNDPRVTRLGAFLRKWSLDELPQLFCVLRGTMSMVGPRPITKIEQDCYGADLTEFQSVKPGLTGYWQVYGRCNCTYQSGERQQMELYYIRNRSGWMDMKLLALTLPAVLSRKGAK